MFFFVYVLLDRSSKRFYIGHTNDLKHRLEEHNAGRNSSTKYGRPWRLIYFEGCRYLSDAVRRERYLKTAQGFRLLKRRLEDDLFRNLDGI